MTGPAHYIAAQNLLERALGVEPDDAEQLIARAHVHATLALAAATGLRATDPYAGLRSADADEWEAACSSVPREGEDVP